MRSPVRAGTGSADMTTMIADDFAHPVEPQAGTLDAQSSAQWNTVKFGKDLFMLTRGQADAIIVVIDTIFPFLCTEPDSDGGGVFGIFDGIINQVVKNNPKRIRVHDATGIGFPLDFNVRFGWSSFLIYLTAYIPDQIVGMADTTAKNRLTFFEAGDIENRVDELIEPLGILLHEGDKMDALLIRDLLFAQGIEIELNGGQRCLELMRHRGDELIVELVQLGMHTQPSEDQRNHDIDGQQEYESDHENRDGAPRFDMNRILLADMPEDDIIGHKAGDPQSQDREPGYLNKDKQEDVINGSGFTFHWHGNITIVLQYHKQIFRKIN